MMILERWLVGFHSIIANDGFIDYDADSVPVQIKLTSNAQKPNSMFGFLILSVTLCKLVILHNMM
ncbi:hypothetical protein ACT3QQ_01470 [Psychrobacter sp. AOP7-A1-24]